MADFVEECNVVTIQELQDPNASAVIGELLEELSARGWDYGSKISDETGYENNPEEGKTATWSTTPSFGTKNDRAEGNPELCIVAQGQQPHVSAGSLRR